ncbi:DUF2142 domain-containing protein [Neolewinella sp.]|uniref:DUF2142 domain-containing protein n=1 Tax=Neolewinella sp. TaxID=2993543 RepID=UPI003B51F32C
MSRHAILTFLLLGGVYGAAFLILTPPYQGPDEPNHLYRAYAISTGEWEPDLSTQRRGGAVPTALVELFAAFRLLRWDARRQTTAAEVRRFAKVPLRPQATTFIDYPNTAVYPAVVYLPAAGGLWVAGRLGTSTLHTLYLARAAGLLTWLLAGALTLWLLPIARWLFVALLLLPMSVFTHAVVSADTLTDGVAFVAVTYLLYLALGRTDRLGARELVVLSVLAAGLASTKLVYTPLLLLGVLIPRERFGGWGPKLAAGVLLGGLTAGVMLFWSGRSAEIYLARSAYDAGVEQELHLPRQADVGAQGARIARAPHRLLSAAANSLRDAAGMYLPGYIGTFGWLDLRLPRGLVWGAYLWLLVVALLAGAPGMRLGWWHRGVLLTAAVGCYLLVVLSQLLSWEPVGSGTVGTIQGRYLTPIGPLLFLLFNRPQRPWPGLPWLVSGGSLVLLTSSVYLVYLRYYVG